MGVTFFQRHFRADDRLYPGAGGRLMEAGRAIKPVAIAQRDRVIAERGGAFGQLFGRARAFQKTERTARPQLDVWGMITHC